MCNTLVRTGYGYNEPTPPRPSPPRSSLSLTAETPAPKMGLPLLQRLRSGGSKIVETSPDAGSVETPVSSPDPSLVLFVPPSPVTDWISLSTRRRTCTFWGNRGGKERSQVLDRC